MSFRSFLLLALLVAAAYCLCLRFALPGYFGPLAPFHGDFYDYTGMAGVPWPQAIRYPRPVTFTLFKIIGGWGVRGSMAIGVAVALLDVFLVLLYATRITTVNRRMPWVGAVLYCALIFTHPQFYIEHRHDMPAMFSLLFGMLALHCWLSWLKHSSAIALLLCPLCIFGFAFSKEAFFVSAFALAAPLLMLYGKRLQTIGFILFCGIAEVAAILYSRSLASPFVDPTAAAAATYHIDASPGSVIRVLAIYGLALFCWPMAALIALGLVQVFPWKRNGLAMTAFLAAGLAALLPISLLPNHVFREYAWLAVPFVLVPVAFLEVPKTLSRQRQAAAAVVVVALFAGYEVHSRRAFRSTEIQWYLDQEKIGRNVLASFRTAAPEIDRARRIAVAGLDTPFPPWAADSYTAWKFGTNRFWSVAVSQNKANFRNSRNVEFLPAAKIDLAQTDLLLIYHADGALDRALTREQARTQIQTQAGLIPELRGIKPASKIDDRAELARDGTRYAHWYLFADARPYFERGVDLGDPQAAFALKQMEEVSSKMAAQAIPSSMEIVPATAVTPDGSGLAVVNLKWKVADGMPVELHVGACDGPLLATAQGPGTAETGKWVRDEMTFYLQDVSGGKALSAANTLVKATAHVR